MILGVEMFLGFIKNHSINHAAFYSIAFVLVLVILAVRHVGSLTPLPGIKPTPPSLESEVLTTGPPGSLHGAF